MRSILIFLFLAITGLHSCYSFRGVSIDPEIQTFTVSQFSTLAGNAPPTISEDFAEALRDKVTNESRLNYSDAAGADVDFSGQIQAYNIKSVAPQEGNTTALTRLEIRVKVNYTNNLDEDSSWNRPFSFFWDFESSEDLLSIQDELIEIIFDKIVEDVFNAAFADW